MCDAREVARHLEKNNINTNNNIDNFDNAEKACNNNDHENNGKSLLVRSTMTRQKRIINTRHALVESVLKVL